MVTVCKSHCISVVTLTLVQFSKAETLRDDSVLLFIVNLLICLSSKTQLWWPWVVLAHRSESSLLHLTLTLSHMTAVKTDFRMVDSRNIGLQKCGPELPWVPA